MIFLKVVFIEKAERRKYIFSKIEFFLNSCFNIIKIKTKQDSKVYYLYFPCNKEIGKNRAKRISYKIAKRLKEDESNTVVLSKSLYIINNLKTALYSNNINILDGRLLFKCLYNKVIDYILNLRGETIENSQIWMTINDYTELNKEIIIDIAKRVKTLNIVTNNINKFRMIEKNLYNDFGILLSISNSKKTSLLKSDIILNIDFSEENLNLYRINSQAIIINFKERIRIYSTRFNGINVNYYSIRMPSKYKIEGFEDQIVYESIICNYNLRKIKEKLENDNIIIENLIGNKGKIYEQEYKKE